MIALERDEAKGDPEREARVWAEKMAEADRKRSRYQEMAAEELITLDELRTKLAELEDMWKMAQRKLEELKNHQERVDELERDRDALLEYRATVVPETLGGLSGVERNKLYRMLRLEVTLTPEDSYKVEGRFCPSELPSTTGSTSSSTSTWGWRT